VPVDDSIGWAALGYYACCILVLQFGVVENLVVLLLADEMNEIIPQIMKIGWESAL